MTEQNVETTESFDPASEKVAEAYIKLRTELDSIEAIALKYFLSGATEEDRLNRALELSDTLKPVAEEIAILAGLKPGDPGGCSEGYYFCNGVCVPYPCWK